MAGAVSAECPFTPGDVNLDGVANIVDVQCVGVTALWSLAGSGSSAPGCLTAGTGGADIDCSGGISVSDMQLAVLHAIGAGLPLALDTDRDLCANACEPKAGVTLRLLSPWGTPIVGAAVSLGAEVATTNAQGQAHWPMPPQGKGMIRAEHPDYVPNRVGLQAGSSPKLEVALVLEPATRYGPFAADAPITIEHELVELEIPGGAVVMPDGTPASGPVEVLVASVNPGATPLEGTPTTLNGLASAGGSLETLFRHHLVEVRLLAGGQPAELAPGALCTVRLPVRGVVAQSQGPGGSLPAWWFDEQAGHWRLEGSGQLEPHPEHGLVWVAQVSHFTWWLAASSFWPYDWSYQQVGCVKAKVTDSITGAPVVGASVWTATSPTKSKQAKTDSAGVACIDFSNGGPVVLSVHHPAHGADVHQIEVGGSGSGGSCKFNPDGCLELAFELEPQGSLRGVLHGADGLPFANHSVAVGLEVPGLSGEKNLTIQTDQNGAFCVSGLPEKPVKLASTLVQDGVVHRMSAVAVPAPSPEGCAGSASLDLGVLTLEPVACGDPSLPPGVLCAVSGPAGSVQSCPLCVASTADDDHLAQAMVGLVKYDHIMTKLQEVTVINCVGQVGCFDINHTDPTLLTGQFFFRIPSVPQFTTGEVALAVMPKSNLNKPITNAKTDGDGTVTSGNAVMANFRFFLNFDIPEEKPLFVTAHDFSLADAGGRDLESHVSGGIITSGDPVSPKPGTGVGCPALPGDIDGSGFVHVHDMSCGYKAVLMPLLGLPLTYCLKGKDPIAAGDFDCSGHLSAVDLFGAAMPWNFSQPLPLALDQNGNKCMDRCEPGGVPGPSDQ
jgi:hypothetical protein